MDTQIANCQGGRSWQAFGKGKNNHEFFHQTRIYYFRDECVDKYIAIWVNDTDEDNNTAAADAAADDDDGDDDV